MADGSKRRDRKRTSKRYRVRYDRILAVLLVLVVLIVIISSCAKSISGDKNKKSTTDNTGQTSTSEESFRVRRERQLLRYSIQPSRTVPRT